MTEPTQESLWPTRWLRPDLMKVLLDCQGAAARVLLDAPASINQYLERLERAASANEFLDVTLGRRLADTALILSADVRRLDPLQQQWLGCAIAYLIDANDATHDMVALDGLDDDAEVLLGLLDALHRSDLAQPIRSHLRR